MGNHVLYDRIWESDKLARCSRNAALAYPWILLVADDHGRFEYRPRRIWTRVFGSREDVTQTDVTKWLEEYIAVGLLVRYHIDGDLAHWVGFKGRKPSDRRPSEYPDPADFPAHTGTDEAGAEEARQEGGEGAETARQKAARSVSDLDQIRSRSTSERSAPSSRRSKANPGEDTPERRELVDAYNATFGTRIGYTPGNLRASGRALGEGYTLEHCKTVFAAVKAGSTPTAAWCRENNREFEYLVRPTYRHTRTQELVQGPLDKIPNELATGRKAG